MIFTEPKPHTSKGRAPLPGRLSWKPKPYKIPADMVLVVDSAEKTKHALCLNIPGLPVVRKSLRHITGGEGDYSIKGFESEFTIELKRSSDFYSYIGSEYKVKTLAKLKRLQRMDFAALLIQSSFSDLFVPPMQSEMSPESARSFISFIQVRHGVHVFINPKKAILERYIIDAAIWYYKMKRSV